MACTEEQGNQLVGSVDDLGAAGTAVGLIGLLHDWGIPEERAKEYETGIHDGGILMGVKARSDEDARYFVQQWQAIGGRLVHS